MPASFKVAASGGAEVLIADFGEHAIARVTQARLVFVVDDFAEARM